jgi:hypothetical protein
MPAIVIWVSPAAMVFSYSGLADRAGCFEPVAEPGQRKAEVPDRQRWRLADQADVGSRDEMSAIICGSAFGKTRREVSPCHGSPLSVLYRALTRRTPPLPKDREHREHRELRS